MLSLALLAFAPAQCLEASDQPPTLDPHTMFASYVSAESDVAVVGTRGDGMHRQAIVYERSGADWVRTQMLDAGIYGGNFSTPLDLDGDTVMVGNIIEAGEAGSVYVFERTGGSFVPVQTLIPTTSRPDSHFGRRIAVDGDRAVIAAPMDATTHYRGGTVYVFDRVGTQWVESARVDPPVSETFGFFGLGLALSGDTFAVAQPGLVTSGGGSPRDVRIFRLQGATWTLEDSLAPTGRGFGYAMDMEGDTLVIGAYNNYVPATGDRGSVHVYRRSGGVWSETQMLTWPVGDDERDFGQTVTLDGNRLAIGAGSPELLNAGAAHVVVYEDVAGTFELTDVVDRPDLQAEGFGTSIAFAGDDLWVGAPHDERGASPNGLVGSLHRFSLAPLVVSYCDQTVPNSTGALGRLEGTGCPTLLANDVVLRGSNLPPFAFGVPFVGADATFLPGAIGGVDAFCVSTAARGPVVQANPQGVVEFGFDTGSIPTAIGAVMGAPGDDWFVQLVHRDTGPGIRATNAVELRIQ